ncbi:MAG: DUF6134 family protein [Bacteroidota bacterium]
MQLKSFAGQTITYDMFLWGDKIGTMTVTKTDKEGGIEEYVLDSKLKAKVLWVTRENTSHLETVFKNGKMISSYQKEIDNGKVKRWNRVTFDGTTYTVDGYKGKRTFTEQPVLSVAPLYFKGLSGATRLFHEAEAEFCTVEKIDNETWQFKVSDGSRNVYHFKDGIPVSLEFHVSIATVKLVRVN